ncbi:hypothetical protein [Leucobacter sp. M11]|uniref:hypothetical protein n=1 Tax=Leucobacter sp. M11 TaxID=2993565 RepID=UPI002D7E1677|nr:hypothetical protein [Leucobacter sp. M11]MEB4614032.1 hypothetical protein [Leucobacter sp. M11]
MNWLELFSTTALAAFFGAASAFALSLLSERRAKHRRARMLIQEAIANHLSALDEFAKNSVQLIFTRHQLTAVAGYSVDVELPQPSLGLLAVSIESASTLLPKNGQKVVRAELKALRDPANKASGASDTEFAKNEQVQVEEFSRRFAAWDGKSKTFPNQSH